MLSKTHPYSLMDRTERKRTLSSKYENMRNVIKDNSNNPRAKGILLLQMESYINSSIQLIKLLNSSNLWIKLFSKIHKKIYSYKDCLTKLEKKVC